MKIAGLCGVLLTCANAGLACERPDAAADMEPVTSDAMAAFVVLDPPPIAQPFKITITYCEPVSRLSVTAIMPAHQHGMNYEPKIDAVSDTTFTASGMVFHMPGAWQIETRATGPNGVVRHVFDTIAK